MSKTTCIKIFSDYEPNHGQLKTMFWRLLLSPFKGNMNIDDGDGISLKYWFLAEP